MQQHHSSTNESNRRASTRPLTNGTLSSAQSRSCSELSARDPTDAVTTELHRAQDRIKFFEQLLRGSEGVFLKLKESQRFFSLVRVPDGFRLSTGPTRLADGGIVSAFELDRVGLVRWSEDRFYDVAKINGGGEPVAISGASSDLDSVIAEAGALSGRTMRKEVLQRQQTDAAAFLKFASAIGFWRLQLALNSSSMGVSRHIPPITDYITETLKPLLAQRGLALHRYVSDGLESATEMYRVVATQGVESRLGRLIRSLQSRQGVSVFFSPETTIRSGCSGLFLHRSPAGPGVVLSSIEIADLLVRKQGISGVLAHELVHARGFHRLLSKGRARLFDGEQAGASFRRHYGRSCGFDEVPAYSASLAWAGRELRKALDSRSRFISLPPVRWIREIYHTCRYLNRVSRYVGSMCQRADKALSNFPSHNEPASREPERMRYPEVKWAPIKTARPHGDELVLEVSVSLSPRRSVVVYLGKDAVEAANACQAEPDEPSVEMQSEQRLIALIRSQLRETSDAAYQIRDKCKALIWDIALGGFCRPRALVSKVFELTSMVKRLNRRL